MNQTKIQHLQKLFTTFEVSGMGAGDINSGANLLAAMSISLANISPVEGSVCYPDGTPARLGTSLLISGALSSGLIIDEVISELSRRQSNFAKHLGNYSNWIASLASKPGSSIPPTGPTGSAADELLGEVLSDIGPFLQSRQYALARVFDSMPVECFQDLATHPKLLVSAARTRDLATQLTGLRPGRPLIHLGINHSSDLAELADMGSALIEGRYPIGNGCETIRGNFVLTDSLRLLNEAAKDPDYRTSWLGHFLWLVDGVAGPDIALDPKNEGPTGAMILNNFRNALGMVIASRIKLEGKKPRTLRFDTRAAAHRWTSFLSKMEPGMPGISGAARNLLNSMLFGLQMIAASDTPLNFTMAEVESFCRYLVHRAVNARSAIIHEAVLARLRTNAEKILRKIEQGCNNRRKICKDTGMLAADFDICIGWLESAGIVQRSGLDANHWIKVGVGQPDYRNWRLPLTEISQLIS